MNRRVFLRGAGMAAAVPAVAVVGSAVGADPAAERDRVAAERARSAAEVARVAAEVARVLAAQRTFDALPSVRAGDPISADLFNAIIGRLNAVTAAVRA